MKTPSSGRGFLWFPLVVLASSPYLDPLLTSIPGVRPTHSKR